MLFFYIPRYRPIELNKYQMTLDKTDFFYHQEENYLTIFNEGRSCFSVLSKLLVFEESVSPGP